MQCPMCSETIPDGSQRCPMCKSNLGASGAAAPVSGARAQEIRADIKKKNALSFLLGIPGIALQVYGQFKVTNASVPLNQFENFQEQIQSQINLGHALQGLGGLLLIGGLCFYASMKGRNPAWGLFGLLSCIGLIVLAVIGKICRNCQTACRYNATECPTCHAPV